jgi:hypothetical protein
MLASMFIPAKPVQVYDPCINAKNIQTLQVERQLAIQK